MVEFIAYTGSWPALCSGTLVLAINGEKVTFEPKEAFWRSGGCIGEEYEPFQDKWEGCPEKLPKHLRKYYGEIMRVFNENVPYGCCGGCV